MSESKVKIVFLTKEIYYNIQVPMKVCFVLDKFHQYCEAQMKSLLLEGKAPFKSNVRLRENVVKPIRYYIFSNN